MLIARRRRSSAKADAVVAEECRALGMVIELEERCSRLVSASSAFAGLLSSVPADDTIYIAPTLELPTATEFQSVVVGTGTNSSESWVRTLYIGIADRMFVARV